MKADVLWKKFTTVIMLNEQIVPWGIHDCSGEQRSLNNLCQEY